MNVVCCPQCDSVILKYIKVLAALHVIGESKRGGIDQSQHSEDCDVVTGFASACSICLVVITTATTVLRKCHIKQEDNSMKVIKSLHFLK